MEQFLMVAAAHFLALLSPGPDFFLVARTSMNAGWLRASGACLGIALANGVFIAAAFAGVSALHPDSALFTALQLAGCAYLLYIGALFIRHAGSSALTQVADDRGRVSNPWFQGLVMGFVSGVLNPKNALFYVSLASLIGGSQSSPGWKLVYGLWMFSAVLLWDLLVAVAVGNQAVRRRFSRTLPWLERVSGAVLMLLALGVIIHLACR
ncbi:LysE family translocator [Pseudomonas rubra]|uniref:LysE family translocator n=1 Tax=Pseudomonas rubra TaxID=2942627 RepID=A0ABT5PFY7_9PSED|nr:LysE family translocator [Pseudomonas rubra]MDD1017042.1 LysE family translocator [Pseudomonas rubra]MDD1037101.1 LysE family translocator [Pseudomonas rubra]MDD1153762.1 LysE family translocator [Pseudomonas rubra]